MSTSALENEDLENVPLVRMEDVQPSRTYETLSRHRNEPIVLDPSLIEEIVYDNVCIIHADGEDIGSMVSIRSDDVVEDDSEPEMIVPEMIDEKAAAAVLEPLTRYQGLAVNEDEEKKPPSSWPTLEILPGGVIKKPEKWDEVLHLSSQDDDSSAPEQMMYACAKCPQRFKFLFCLVKHVKWHEEEAKKLVTSVPEVKPKQSSAEIVSMHTKKRRVVIHPKPPKKKSPKKLKS